MPAQKHQLLLVSIDRRLTITRVEVLRRNGIAVNPCYGESEATWQLEAQLFDALFVCSTLSGPVQERIISLFRKRNPDRKIIVVHNVKRHSTTADVVLEAPVTPQALLHAVNGALIDVPLME